MKKYNPNQIQNQVASDLKSGKLKAKQYMKLTGNDKKEISELIKSKIPVRQGVIHSGNYKQPRGHNIKQYKDFITEGITSLASANTFTLAKLSLAAIFSKMNSNSRLLKSSNTNAQNAQILNQQIMLLAALIAKQNGNEKMLEYLESQNEDDSIEEYKTRQLFEEYQNNRG